jgi:hypothetical protein
MNSHLLPQNIIVSDGQAPDRFIRSEAKYLRPRADDGKRREAITFSDFDIRSDEDIAFENTILADSDVRAYDAIRPYDNAISQLCGFINYCTGMYLGHAATFSSVKILSISIIHYG